MAAFPFSDLHSFKDYVAFVRMCAPDNFPQREGVPTELQWSLSLAFKGLREGLAFLPQNQRSSGVYAQLFDEAYRLYEEGDKKGGFLKLAEAQRVLAKIRSQ
jgi:hypothetical protein